MSTISERVEELRLQYIGKTLIYRGESRTGRVTEIEGTVTDVAFAGCSISNDRGEWLGIKFRIRNGRRHIWTAAMPDEPPEPPEAEGPVSSITPDELRNRYR